MHQMPEPRFRYFERCHGSIVHRYLVIVTIILGLLSVFIESNSSFPVNNNRYSSEISQDIIARDDQNKELANTPNWLHGSHISMATQISIEISFLPIINDDEIRSFEGQCLIFLSSSLDQKIQKYGKVFGVELFSQEFVSNSASTDIIGQILRLRILVHSKIFINDLNSVFKFENAIKRLFVDHFEDFLDLHKLRLVDKKVDLIESILPTQRLLPSTPPSPSLRAETTLLSIAPRQKPQTAEKNLALIDKSETFRDGSTMNSPEVTLHVWLSLTFTFLAVFLCIFLVVLVVAKIRGDGKRKNADRNSHQYPKYIDSWVLPSTTEDSFIDVVADTQKVSPIRSSSTRKEIKPEKKVNSPERPKFLSPSFIVKPRLIKPHASRPRYCSASSIDSWYLLKYFSSCTSSTEN